MDTLLDLLEQNTADIIRRCTLQEPFQSEELSYHFREVIRNSGDESTALSFWMDRAEGIAMARQESLAPVNRKLLIQNLLLPWIGVTGKLGAR